jgi:hypothetical protein
VRDGPSVRSYAVAVDCGLQALDPVLGGANLRQQLDSAAILDAVLGHDGVPEGEAVWAQLARRRNVGRGRIDNGQQRFIGVSFAPENSAPNVYLISASSGAAAPRDWGPFFFDLPRPLEAFATGRSWCVWNADLILNKVSGAHNVIVMAGVPSIMQAMLDEVAPKLKIGVPMLSETVRADAREWQHRDATRRDRRGQS